MHWSIYAIFSAIFGALVAILGKLGLKGIDTTLATTLRSIVMAIFLIVVSAGLGKLTGATHFGGKAVSFIVMSGIAGALSWLFYFFAIKAGNVTGAVAIDRTSVVFAFMLAVMFLGESLTWQKLIGAVMMVGGAILMSLK
jgi:transporter family protein